MIHRIQVDIEMNHGAYESSLSFGRAKANVATDFFKHGLNFAMTTSNGERVKTVLAAVLLGASNTFDSVDKNFFREETVEIIISKMRANRDRVRNLVVEEMSKMTVLEYPFEEGWADLTEYFCAGTLQSGIQGLSVDAAKDADKAKKESDNLDRERISNSFAIATRRNQDDTRLIRSKYNELYREEDVATAKSALKELQVALKAGATDEEVRYLLEDQITVINKVEGQGDQQRTVIDKEQVKKLKKALKID